MKRANRFTRYIARRETECAECRGIGIEDKLRCLDDANLKKITEATGCEVRTNRKGERRIEWLEIDRARSEVDKARGKER